MVVFTCQKCNSTLKKNAVEKHYSCRPFYLTCIDCLKDFMGKEYEEHKSCITEAQKYGGSNVTVKAAGVKQEKWIDQAREIIESLSHLDKYGQICNVLRDVPNIPRNRKKFHNFLKSAYPKMYKTDLANEIFNHLEKAKINNGEITKQNNKKVEEEESINLKEENCLEKPKLSHKKSQSNKRLMEDVKITLENGGNLENEDENNDALNGENNENLHDKNGNDKLSKKERKKLKKQQKFMAEIDEMEKQNPIEDDSMVDIQEENIKKKKKKKKVVENEAETISSHPNPKRKLKSDDGSEYVDGKKFKLNDTLQYEEVNSTNSGKKFKWGNAIKQILEHNENKELPLKKLRKKVLNEYTIQKGDDVSFEKLFGIFNKKVNSTKGVIVNKERARLVDCLTV